MPNLAYCTLRNEMKLNEKNPDTLRNEPIAINSNECSLERFPGLPYAARQVKRCVSPQYERRKAKSRKKKSPKQTCREKKKEKKGACLTPSHRKNVILRVPKSDALQNKK